MCESLSRFIIFKQTKIEKENNLKFSDGSMIKTQTFELKIKSNCLPLNALNVIKQTKFLFLSEKCYALALVSDSKTLESFALWTVQVVEATDCNIMRVLRWKLQIHTFVLQWAVLFA